jgi:hypothetical protein
VAVTCVQLLEIGSAFGFPRKGGERDGHVTREPLNPRCGSGDVRRSSNHRSELWYCMLCTVAKTEVISEMELTRCF